MNERDIFTAALHLPPEARSAFLEEACGDCTSLQERVKTLLREQEELGSFLEVPALPAQSPSARWDAERAGSTLGPYELLVELGEGGMGTVWMAQQEKPVQRKVAIKIVKPGMDTRQVVARFEQERQALALMDHPNIAKVLDAGTTECGRPYFVMELVRGVPITRYCHEWHLTPRQRLELFVSVCEAVQHAHQKGVIHRDIKPSNVLLAEYDQRPVPKVIDFGVAKAIGPKLTDKTLVTNFGTIVGTLEYMSPEQARFTALDVDTRSDVYSLGVLLYELLTGMTPFDGKRLRETPLDEALRLIREEEPPRPSTRLLTTEEMPAAAAGTEVERKRLSGVVRGELDWIVMKCLEKDRNRRYETANGLAMDVRRYLADEPVLACPPSPGYRLGKVLRKYRRAVVGVGVLLAVLLAGVVGTTLGLIRARRAESEARDYAQAEHEARQAEAAERKQAEAAAGLLEGLFRNLDPGQEQKGRTLRYQLADWLDQTAAGLDEESAGEPLTRARLGTALGRGMLGLGEVKKAIALLEPARREREARLGIDHADTLATRNHLAEAYRAAGRFPEAIALQVENLARCRATLGLDHLDTLRAQNNLALAYQQQGRVAEALRLHEDAVRRCEASLGDTHLDTLAARSGLATAYYNAGRFKEALALHEKTLTRREASLGPNHLHTLTSRSNLTASYLASGHWPKALPLAEGTLKARERVLGPTHPDTLLSRNLLGEAYRAAGRSQDAVAMHQEALTRYEATLGIDHPATLTSRNNLAISYRRAGKEADAIRLLEQTIRLLQAKFTADHPKTLLAENNLALAYEAAGRKGDAIRLLEATLKRSPAALGDGHALLVTLTNNLAQMYQASGRNDEAVRLLQEHHDRCQAKLGEGHGNTLSARTNLAEMLRTLKRHAEAIPLHEQVLKAREAQLDPGHPQRLTSMTCLALACQAAGRVDRAIPLLERVAEVSKANLGMDVPHTLGTMKLLADAYRAKGLLHLEEPIVRLLYEHWLKRGGPDSLHANNFRGTLGVNLFLQKRYAEAEPLLLKTHEVLARAAGSGNGNELARIRDLLARLYASWGKPAEAAKWRAAPTNEQPGGNDDALPED